MEELIKWLDKKDKEYNPNIDSYNDVARGYNIAIKEVKKQLMLGGVSQQRELLDWLSNEPDHNIRKSDIDEIIQDFKYYQSNCG